jgi:hypothetical protein
MEENDIKIGRRVRSLREFSGVPKGTTATIINDDGKSIEVSWERPQDLNSSRPLHDWFSRNELNTLEIV